MLKHALKPGESAYIRGTIELKNLSGKRIDLGFIGDGEVSFDAVHTSHSQVQLDK